MSSASKVGTILFDMSEIPQEEHREAWMVFYSILMLDQYARAFNCAHALVGYSENLEHQLTSVKGWEAGPVARNSVALYREWKAIAARDGAVSIYHFCTTFDSIKSANVPTVIKKVDHTKMKVAARTLRGRFPRYEAIRHGVTHTADFTRNYKAFLEHAKDGKEFIWGRLVGRRYTVTYDKVHFSYDLDRTSVEALLKVARLVTEAFADTGFAQQSLS